MQCMSFLSQLSHSCQVEWELKLRQFKAVDVAASRPRLMHNNDGDEVRREDERAIELFRRSPPGQRQEVAHQWV